jgi:hypothetical protein
MRGGALGVRASEVINMVPDELLDRLADETGVDYSVQKLHGKTLFKLFLFGLLQEGDVSLRVLETIFSSRRFQTLFPTKVSGVKHSSIGMRLENIKYAYFERIFESLLTHPELQQICFGDKKIQTHKIDSTFVGIAEKLLTIGVRNGRSADRKHLKYSVAISGSIPVNIVLYTERSAVSEDIALPPLVKNIPKNTEQTVHIAVFDQGVRKKLTFLELVDTGVYFVSRAEKHKFKIVEKLSMQKQQNDHIVITDDQIVQFSRKKTETRTVTFPQHLRLVVGQSTTTGKTLHFITNIRDLSALEIAELYRSRWEIETFFKFIKQELGFTHLISRNQNGARAVMYLTMIAAILLTLYKKQNRIASWRVAKIKFIDELTFDIIETWHAELARLFEQKQPSSRADPQ